MTWPFDEKEVDIAGALENIEVIIRHDHGPDSLLDDAGRKQFAVRPTSQPRIPFIAQARSSDHIPSDIGIPNLAGGQLPIEPLPGREITTQDTVDEADVESQAGVTNTESPAPLPPAEIY